MHTGEFSESESDNPTYERSKDKTENDGRSGQFNGGGCAEQEAGSDGAPDRHHGHLTGTKLVSKAGFRGGCRRSHEWWLYQKRRKSSCEKNRRAPSTIFFCSGSEVVSAR